MSKMCIISSGAWHSLSVVSPTITRKSRLLMAGPHFASSGTSTPSIGKVVCAPTSAGKSSRAIMGDSRFASVGSLGPWMSLSRSRISIMPLPLVPSQHFLVLRIGTGVERYAHPAAQRIALGEVGDREDVGIVGGDNNFPIGAGLVPVNVILPPTLELRSIRFNRFLSVGNIPVEHRLLFSGLIVKLLKPRPGGVVLIDAGQPEFKKLPLHVVARGRIGFRKIERRQRVVDVMIQGDGGLRGARLGEHRRSVIAKGGVRMDLFHQP